MFPAHAQHATLRIWKEAHSVVFTPHKRVGEFGANGTQGQKRTLGV